MNRYNSPTFPPKGPWDPRMFKPCCDDLQPVKVLHENPWFALGLRGSFYTTEFSSVPVVILPVVDHRAFVMVRVYRPVLADIPLELPAGGVDEGESPERGSLRELKEETGIEIKDVSRLKPMPPIAVSPNHIPTLIYVFQVDLHQEEFEQRQSHDKEIEKVELLSFKKAAEWIVSGGIYVSVPKAIIGQYLLNRSLTGKEWTNQS